jgi:CBS domain-containing protein
MVMKVKDLSLQPILSTIMPESIADAADRMKFYEVGSLAVIDSGYIVGVITERDIVTAVADRQDAERIPVRSYLTPAPATISSDTDIADAAELMLSLDVRHLPVVDGVTPVGMVSIRDLLAAELTVLADVPC